MTRAPRIVSSGDDLVVGVHTEGGPVREDDRPAVGRAVLQIAHRENACLDRLHIQLPCHSFDHHAAGHH
jgi:hypothetical protein